jgi:DNA-binding MarR family transcriptional regulator
MRAAPETERSAGTKTNPMAERFTPKQGQYLAFIYNYTVMNGRAPAEADLERFFRTTYPTIHQMILKLEEKGLISRVPGQARSIKLLVDPEEIPRLLPPKTE